jgi:hypothetical protein
MTELEVLEELLFIDLIIKEKVYFAIVYFAS